MPWRCSQAPHQQEVVAGVLLLAEQGVDHDASSVIDGQQQREGRTMVSKPPVMAAVHLHQHALLGASAAAGHGAGADDGGVGSSDRHLSVSVAVWFDRSLSPHAP